MKLEIAIGATAIIIAQCFSIAALAQTADPRASAPASTSAGAVMQAQLNARAPEPKRVGGVEADAIYKRYLAGIGQPMVSTTKDSGTQSGSAMHSAGDQ